MSTQVIEAVKALAVDQRAAVAHSGNFALIARPGSGKTRTVGLRLAMAAAAQTRRTAVASYTRVAVEEIRGVCEEAGVVVGPAHFVGTLHGFLNAYVLRPFGHLVTGATRPLSVRDDEWGASTDSSRGWRRVPLSDDGKLGLPVSSFHFDRTGRAVCHSTPPGFNYLSPEEVTSRGSQRAASLKTEHAKHGVISQSDALYWSLRVLQEHPRIAAAVAGRFDEIIVDEAQDTSDVQLACLEALQQTECLASLVLVADVEQSIYGFQGADPERFQQFAATCGLEALELHYNYRSSQRICDVAHRFTQRPKPDIAAGQHAACTIPPEVLRYPDSDPVQARTQFQARLEHHGLDDNAAACLARSTRLRDTLNGRKRPDVHRVVRRLARFAAAIQSGSAPTLAEVTAVEDTLIWMINGRLDRRQIPHASLIRLRRAAVSVGHQLPPVKGNLAEWVVLARGVVKAALDDLVRDGHTLDHKPGDVLKAQPKYTRINAETLAIPPDDALHAQTVHAVKGRSIDAVLLVVEPATSRNNPARLLTTLDSGDAIDPDEREELRIGFVSVTRAERYCAVALPDSVAEDVFVRYVAMGFEAA